MQNERNKYIARCILVILIAVFVVCILVACNLSSKAMFPAILLVGAITIHLLANMHIEYKEGKLQKAKDFLVKCTSEVYFYGYPLSECIENGAVMQLCFEGIGDFSLPVAELMLYAIRDEDQGKEPIIYIGDGSPQEVACNPKNGPRKVYINFEFGGQYWLYRVDSFELDGTSLRPASSNKLDSTYFEQHYWGVRSYLRKRIERCTSPETSNLEPEVWFLDCPEEEYTELVKRAIRHCLSEEYACE